MFKWVKVSGCNCCPLEEGTEKYILNVGDVWGGVVQSHSCGENEPGKFYWESSYTVCGNQVSGQSGGGYTRDENMEWIENAILEAIRQVESVSKLPIRKIFNALCERNPVTGEFEQKEIT